MDIDNLTSLALRLFFGGAFLICVGRNREGAELDRPGDSGRISGEFEEEMS